MESRSFGIFFEAAAAFLLVAAPAAKAAMSLKADGTSQIDLFSSTDELRLVFEKEATLHARLREYLEQTDRQIAALDSLLDEHYGEGYPGEDADEEAAREYVSNPINTYVLLKRTGLHWPKVKATLFNESAVRFEDVLDEVGYLPGQMDLEGAANGIFLLHETYNLDLKKFSEGVLEIPGTNGETLTGKSKLDIQDLEIIGKLAFNRGYYDRATEWLEAAIWKAEKQEVGKDHVENLKGILKIMKEKHDKALVTKGPRGKDWRTYLVPFNKELAKKKKFKKALAANGGDKRFRVKAVSSSTTDTSSVSITDDELWDLFNAVCRGDPGVRPRELDAGMACTYLDNGNPYLRLGPFKLEAKNRSPFVAVFRDFMSESETDSYRSVSADKLVRSQHYNKDGNPNHASVKRTSSQVWLTEVDLNGTEVYSKRAAAVTRRIELATRLNAQSYEAAETYQVANYGIGGVYNHHLDSMGEAMVLPEDELGKALGDRLATSMSYLTDVTAGGATAFPNLGLAVWPQRGDMVFWYNDDRNGKADPWTYHGGCPVLAGSKWITNKWIRTRAQFQLYPCTLESWTNKDFKRLKPLDNDLCKVTEECKWFKS